MIRFLAKLLLLLLFAVGTAAAVVLALSRDPFYTAADWMSRGRYQRYDAMIADAAAKYGVDPLLLKALVWRESEFHPHKTGASGERGLMQVSLGAANDWARANKAETFQPADLFSPRMNLEIGAWYLRQKLNRWAEKDDPVPFALAEYNAGGTRVDHWIDQTQLGRNVTAADLRSRIPFPSTRAYVEAILRRYAYYQAEQKRAAEKGR
ncbi:MAG: transglycosylase SLT domain-containing protein [Chthoniobacteraceae bacterium]|nr:transglycosylase SLT domain-containing protein [Chthoniobacteraceae bacterium]